MRTHTIRVGVVGAGRNTRERHIPRLQTLPGVEVVSVCNRTRESSERVAREFGIPNVYNHWQALVKSSDTDAVVIGTWPNLHAPVTLAALAAGKHVLCEARMAMDHAEARAMLAASRARPHLAAQLVPAPFTLAIDPVIRHMENQGFLGKLLALDVRACSGAFADPEAPLQWRQDQALSGQNVMSLGIWYETVMRWFGEAARVTAAGRICVPQRHDTATRALRKVEIPDHLDVIAEMACGAQAHFLVSGIAGLTPSSEVCAWGTEGTLVVRDGRLLAGRRGESALTAIPPPEGAGDGWRVEEEFVAAIRGEGQVAHTTFADGERYMAFTAAVWQSMETGRTVPVPPAGEVD